MGGKGSTTVEAPDPLEVASTDALFNRIDQFTPTGNLTFSDRPGGPEGANNVATLTLPPEVQALFESQVTSDQALLDLALGRQGDFEEGLPPLIDELSVGPGEAQDAFFDRSAELLNRQFDRDEDRLRQSLANRGLTGATDELGEAASTELGLFRAGKADAFENLSNAAVREGISAELQDANIRQSNRATQFNELAALLGLDQVAQPGLGNFFAPANADVGGAFALQNQANIANAQNAQSQRNAVLGGLFGLGSAALGSNLFGK